MRPPGLHGNFIVCVCWGSGDNGVEELKVVVEGVSTWFGREMNKLLVWKR